VKLRKEIRSLTPDDLRTLRRAWSQLQANSGDGSHVAIAGYHGIPRHHCPHGSPLFLPWHRVYVTTLEDALRTVEPNVTLPFWDWTSAESLREGVAAGHSEPIAEIDPPARVDNPLFSGPIADLRRRTRRGSLHNVARLASHAATARLAFDAHSYMGFNEAIERPHGSVHVWVGGDMGSVPRAAFDPIFWSHHTFIDRCWASWQIANPGGEPPTDVMKQPLPGFPGWTVADTLDHRAPRLDFTYEGLEGQRMLALRRPDADGRAAVRVPSERACSRGSC
jgi:hypothetical protein